MGFVGSRAFGLIAYGSYAGVYGGVKRVRVGFDRVYRLWVSPFLLVHKTWKRFRV